MRPKDSIVTEEKSAIHEIIGFLTFENWYGTCDLENPAKQQRNQNPQFYRYLSLNL